MEGGGGRCFDECDKFPISYAIYVRPVLIISQAHREDAMLFGMADAYADF